MLTEEMRRGATVLCLLHPFVSDGDVIDCVEVASNVL